MNRVLHNICCCEIASGNTGILSQGNLRTFLRHSSPSNFVSSIKQLHTFSLSVFGRPALYTALCRSSLKSTKYIKYASVGQNRFLSVFSRCNRRKFKDIFSSNYATTPNSLEVKHKTVLIYLTSVAVFTVGLSYAAVPLYRLYCQASGYGGTTQNKSHDGDDIEDMQRIEERPLTVRFEGSTSKKLQWKFKPQQKEVKLAPGETALAFYTAKNLTDRPIIGVATYNVIPFDAGQYFNKIQCFCFEEQQLNPNEEVDMPVFFYIDPEFDEDPKMAKVEEIILSYVFFESSDSNMAPSLLNAGGLT